MMSVHLTYMDRQGSWHKKAPHYGETEQEARAKAFDFVKRKKFPGSVFRIEPGINYRVHSDLSSMEPN